MASKKTILKIGGGVVLVLAAVGILAYMRYAGGRVSAEKSQIVAPFIALAPQGSGTLEEVTVRSGDVVPANFVVARVGTEAVKTRVAGEIVSVTNNVGKLVNRGEAVVTMIDPNDLRVIARVEEDKGLESIRVGQTVTFTVDAFGSKQYHGIVDEISATSRDSDIAFSISDKRETREFNVKIRFNVSAYPELKNGMSAKAVILKQ